MDYGPLAPSPSRVARARSHMLRELASLAVPRSVLVLRGARRRRRIALTFDDGPDALTPRYLDLLSRLGVRATFFLVGENAARSPELAREYVRRGHEVGGHGWSHEEFANMSTARLAAELARTKDVLPADGVRPLVRPPRGSLSARALLHIAKAGYTTVMWSLDSDDCRSSDPRTIEERLAPDRVSPGDIVLLHEMQRWTLEALPAAVMALRRNGWELVTVRELMGFPMVSTETRIRGILQRVARVEGDYSASADIFRDLGVKSIAALDLLLSMEEEFGVTIADEAFGRARNVGALVALVEQLR